jgi:diacylglycerol kinase family enzyme
MKVLLVVNPSASGVTARGRVVIQNALAAAHDLTVAETKRRGHATRLAQGAASTGVDVVVAMGGDGTVNEVANGLVRTATALAVLPGGSTNVFARTLGLVNEPVEAANQILGAMGRSSIRRVGLGNVNGRFFCFHVGMGYDAAVVEQVERRGQLKRWLGHPLFAYAAIDTWVRRYDREHPAFRVELPGAERRSAGGDSPPFVASTMAGSPGPGIDGFFAVCLNTDPYTFLGSRPLSLVPEATLDDPLGLVTLTSLKLGTTLRAIGAALKGKGALAHQPTVDVRTGLHSFTVRAHRPFPWQVDGDHLGDADVLEFRWEPKVLDLVMP